MGKRDELRRRLEALANFRDALIEFVNLSEFSDDTWGGRSAVSPKPARELEWRQAKGLVDQLAPRAAKSFMLANVAISWKPAGTRGRFPISPATDWGRILETDPRVGLANIETCLNQAKGALEEQLETAYRISMPALPRLRWRHISPLVKWLVGIFTTILTAFVLLRLGLS